MYVHQKLWLRRVRKIEIFDSVIGRWMDTTRYLWGGGGREPRIYSRLSIILYARLADTERIFFDSWACIYTRVHPLLSRHVFRSL